MGYFDHIKADTTLTSKQKKAAFMSQLRENKIAVYPSLMVSVLKSLGICKSELADRLQVSSSDISRITTKSFHLSPRKLICQCCGMPLEDSVISRESDGTFNEDYCKWCYSDGSFAYPTKESLLDYLVGHMPNPDHTKDEDRRMQFDAYLSQLKHWK